MPMGRLNVRHRLNVPCCLRYNIDALLCQGTTNPVSFPRVFPRALSWRLSLWEWCTISWTHIPFHSLTSSSSDPALNFSSPCSSSPLHLTLSSLQAIHHTYTNFRPFMIWYTCLLSMSANRLIIFSSLTSSDGLSLKLPNLSLPQVSLTHTNVQVQLIYCWGTHVPLHQNHSTDTLSRSME